MAGSLHKGDKKGQIVAVDVNANRVKARIVTPYPIYSGLLGTAGNLIFAGHLDGRFSAYDADTLAELWSVNVGMPI